MKTLPTALKALALALMLTFFGGLQVVEAQPAPNPTAQSVREDQLLQALKPGAAVSGRITIPDAKASTLIQPANQSWTAFHQGRLQTIGAVSLIGTVALLAIFLLVRGRIRVDAGFSGRTVTRFGGVERFIHWITAGCFIVLALTGLNLTFGKSVVLPLFGEGAFAMLAGWGKIAHNYLSFPFMAGVLLMLVVWVRDNIPGKLDWEWIKAGGGIFTKGSHPPAARFNAGQKGIFWIVIIGGAAMSFSGWRLLFPFADGPSVADQQFWVNVHAVGAMLFIAVMIAHAYIGSVGMEGAFDAMGSGQVDENWAKEHHALWLEEEKARQNRTPPNAVPAE